MPTGTILLLGAFAGLTIYLGLPLAFLQQAPQSLKSFASMLAAGVLIFLLYDVLGKASEPIVGVLDHVRLQNTGSATFFLDLSLFISGLGLGLVGLVYFNRYVVVRFKSGKPTPTGGVTAAPSPRLALAGSGIQELSVTDTKPGVVHSTPRVSSIVATSPRGELAPQVLALIIATGIGLHNFSEGLAIGQSAAAGALQLAAVLIIGFGLHNMTEGFGIAVR
jgi:ZIP family zinc transporter